jgi:hypothetical protein
MHMPSCNRTLLAARVMWRLLWFDALLACRGFRSVYRNLSRHRLAARAGRVDLETAICKTVTQVSAFYWKPVRCLQRSAVTARVLRSYGIDATVVIGYQPAPLYSHAWVEVEGRVVDGSSAFQRKLCPLTRI